MGRSLGLAIIVLLNLQAESSICVRNYVSQGTSACEYYPESYHFAKSIEGPNVCVREYNEWYCQQDPIGYQHVQSIEGKRFCTVEFDQPTVINLCAKYPQWYEYVEEALFSS